MIQPKVAVIYYSATGTVHRLARAVEEGAREAGAEVRLRKVAELAPEAAIRSNPAWAAHREATRDVPTAELADLEWADAYVFGSPTRYGNVTAQLKEFLDLTGGLWAQGKTANKVAAGFTAASNPHGGQESTLLALYNTLYHWGCLVVPPGYTDPVVFGGGGNPYGVSWAATNGQPEPTPQVLDAARYLGRRVATVSRWVLAGRAAQ
jgi:NAD(P)H dehydrogenase (quinone)